MRPDVIKWTTPRQLRINQPASITAREIEPGMETCLGEYGAPNCSFSQQFSCALDLRIRPPVIGDAENAAILVRHIRHLTGFGVIHRHGLLTQHMLASA